MRQEEALIAALEAATEVEQAALHQDDETANGANEDGGSRAGHRDQEKSAEQLRELVLEA